MQQKKTKIVCTLGPATDSVTGISKLISAGMNVARINFSHGSHQSLLSLIENARTAAQKTGSNLAILQDLQGPKIRLGKLPEAGLSIKKNQQLILDTGTDSFTENPIPTAPVQYQSLHRDVNKGDIILIEDGLIELKVLSKSGTKITCQAKTNSLLKSNKGINVPTASISADPLTDKDRRDLKFGLQQKVDYIALSFVRKADDIVKLRQLIQKAKSSAKIIAKIERHEAVKNLSEIVAASDAVMVARGDLGVEIPAELVPIVQKRIIREANILGKPVIVATEVLQSMIEKPRATRAEVSDAANGVYDHTDALMLSNETAVGKYPQQAVATLTKVSSTIEQELYSEIDFIHPIAPDQNIITDSVSVNAAELAIDINAKCIVAITRKGYTALQIAKQRISTPIIAFTESETVKRQLALVWGINHIFLQKLPENSYLQQIDKTLQKEKLVKKGDQIVVVSSGNAKKRSITILTI